MSNDDECDEQKLISMMVPQKYFTTEEDGCTRIDYYLTGVIGDPSDYLELCHILRAAGPMDIVVLHINSPGGQLRSGNMIINAIEECRGSVIGYIEHDCGSMATMIFLACDTWAVAEFGEFFIHTMSSGNYGKEHETFESAVFLRKQVRKTVTVRYNNFLSEEEIEKVISGTDIYLDADQIIERLEVLHAFREAQMERIEEEFLHQEEPEEDLETIVKGIIEDVLKDKASKPKRAVREK